MRLAGHATKCLYNAHFHGLFKGHKSKCELAFDKKFPCLLPIELHIVFVYGSKRFSNSKRFNSNRIKLRTNDILLLVGLCGGYESVMRELLYSCRAGSSWRNLPRSNLGRLRTADALWNTSQLGLPKILRRCRSVTRFVNFLANLRNRFRAQCCVSVGSKPYLLSDWPQAMSSTCFLCFSECLFCNGHYCPSLKFMSSASWTQARFVFSTAVFTAKALVVVPSKPHADRRHSCAL